MSQKTILFLCFFLGGAIILGVWTIFFTPGSELHQTAITSSGDTFQTQSLTHAQPVPPRKLEKKDGFYVPIDPDYAFDPHYGLQGRQWSK